MPIFPSLTCPKSFSIQAFDMWSIVVHQLGRYEYSHIRYTASNHSPRVIYRKAVSNRRLALLINYSIYRKLWFWTSVSSTSANPSSVSRWTARFSSASILTPCSRFLLRFSQSKYTRKITARNIVIEKQIKIVVYAVCQVSGTSHFKENQEK